jgi:hypothetical protein
MESDPKPLRPEAYRAFSAAHRAPIGRGNEAALDPIRSSVTLLSPPEAAVLTACHGAATLDEHAARAATAGVPGTRAAIRGILNDLVARGVLVSDADLGRLLAGAEAQARAGDAEAPDLAPITVLGVPTRDRPRSLRRALESYARDLAASGRALEVVVVDDSTTEALVREASEVSRDVAARTGARLRYVGPAAKKRFARELAEASGAPLGVVERALAASEAGVFAAGAGRNALLLDAAGQRALQVDDDTIGDARGAPGALPGVSARSFEDPTDMWFDEREGAAGPLATDYPALHERLLGRRGSALLGDAGGDLGTASAPLFGRLLRGGRVRCTQLGLRGDSALGTMMYLLTIGQPARSRLLASEAIYRGAVTSRRLARAVPIATITELDGCMTAAIGLDARAILPPFPPVERNEDGLFGAALGACDRSALFGHLPWTIAHEPEDVRPSTFELLFEQPGRIGVNDLIAGLVGSSLPDIDHETPSSAVASLGRALLAWADLPEPDLFERASWLLARRVAQRLARIAALLREERRTPAFWARDLDRLADVLRERVEEPDRAIPFELLARHGRAGARAVAVRRVREYGELLVHWPALWEAARSLRAGGHRLGEVYT